MKYFERIQQHAPEAYQFSFFPPIVDRFINPRKKKRRTCGRIKPIEITVITSTLGGQVRVIDADCRRNEIAQVSMLKAARSSLRLKDTLAAIIGRPTCGRVRDVKRCRRPANNNN
jgi:hypothetical protein